MQSSALVWQQLLLYSRHSLQQSQQSLSLKLLCWQQLGLCVPRKDCCHFKAGELATDRAT
jgi:hypothetical protein